MRRICRAGIYFAALCPAVEVLLLSLVQITVAFDEALIPPKFPDIFSSFSKSLSASDSLRLFVHSLVDDDKLCGCGEYGRVPVNWTEFSANLGAVKRCAPTTNGNGREPNNAAISGGQTGQAQPLVIGVSVAVVVVVVAVICFLAFNRNSFLRRIALTQERLVQLYGLGCCEKKVVESGEAEKQLPASPSAEESGCGGVCK